MQVWYSIGALGRVRRTLSEIRVQRRDVLKVASARHARAFVMVAATVADSAEMMCRKQAWEIEAQHISLALTAIS